MPAKGHIVLTAEDQINLDISNNPTIVVTHGDTKIVISEPVADRLHKVAALFVAAKEVPFVNRVPRTEAPVAETKTPAPKKPTRA